MGNTSTGGIRDSLSIAARPTQHGSEYKNILRLLWLGAAGLVTLFSLLPASSPPLRAMIQGDDKLEHFAAYAVLAFLPSLHERRRILVWMVLAVIGLGVGLEFGQLLSEGRRFEVEDMVADSYGVLAGIIMGLPSRSWIQRQERSK